MSHRRPITLTLLLLLAVLIAPLAVSAQDGPQPGSPGLDDPLFPLLGNGGYDVTHYALDLVWEPEARLLSGTTVVEALATQDLSAFNLDFAGYEISAISVNGADATFARADQELTVTPAAYLPEGEPFTVSVTYSGVPQPLFDRGAPVPVGWVSIDDRVVYAVDADPGWYPSNDIDRERATFDIRVTLPKPLVVAATGYLAETIDNGDTTTYVWRQDQPIGGMTLLIDEFESRMIPMENGPTITVYYPAGNADAAYAVDQLDFVPGIIEFYTETFGPAPYDSLTIVVATGLKRAAYSFTTVMAFPTYLVMDREFMAHEIAHQWWGNGVGLYTSLDNWLSEGFATYSAGLYGQSVAGGDFDPGWSLSGARHLQAPGVLTADTLYNEGVYYRGAWALRALQLEVGDETFFAIMRTYYDRYLYGVATVDDFIAVAEEVSGQELDELFQGWLFDEVAPDLPDPAD